MNINSVFTKHLKQYIQPRFSRKYPHTKNFNSVFKKYMQLKSFKANENIFETNQEIDEQTHYVMRLATQYFLDQAMRAMLVDVDNDPNTAEDLSVGNIGTPGRIAKTWVGCGTHDDTELASGRFMKPVRIASFPNENKDVKIPITKRVSLTALCSHHALAFSTKFDDQSYAIISYIPGEKVLGISKLQRLADYVGMRMWLQEDLTKELYNQISKVAETEDVYVKLVNVKHSCEWIRGAKNNEGGFSSEYYGGVFKDPEIRKSVIIK